MPAPSTPDSQVSPPAPGTSHFRVHRAGTLSAGFPDSLTDILRLLNRHESRSRRRAMDALSLGPGSLLLVLGQMPGRRFLQCLADRVGREGRIQCGVPEPMPGRPGARHSMAFPEKTSAQQECSGPTISILEPDAIFSEYALSSRLDGDEVVRRAAVSLRPGGRLVVRDLYPPDHWPFWLRPCMNLLCRLLGVSPPIVDIASSMACHIERTGLWTDLLGAGFTAVGESR